MESIDLTKDVMLGNVNSPHDRIYYSSNEDLGNLFRGTSFRNKDVLTVLGSGDQVFSLYQKDAKKVETFDINPLSKFYYHLRKWGIVYLDNQYPDVFSNEAIYKILQLVNPKDELEREAFKYWMEYIKTFYPFFTKELFFVSANAKTNEIKDLKKLKERLINEKFIFHNMDLSKEKLPSKHDAIIISNILEYYASDRVAMKNIVSNLYDMLSDEGQVFVSYLMNLTSTSLEDSSFSPYFYKWDLFDNKGSNIGRIYYKK